MPPVQLPVVVIGAGPVGLAAAAHLREHGLAPLVLEAASDVAAHVTQWAHVQLFTPWDLNVDPAARRLLDTEGWVAPAGAICPTGQELIDRYLEPLAATSSLRDHLRFEHRVLAVSRDRRDKASPSDRDARPFVVQVQTPSGRQRIFAQAVIDASGTWQAPNPLGADGLPAIGELDHDDRILYGLPDVLGRQRQRFEGHRVAVVGSGHSAQTVVRDLASLAELGDGPPVHWILRRHDIAGLVSEQPNEPFAARGLLQEQVGHAVATGAAKPITDFGIVAVTPPADGVQLHDGEGATAGPFDLVVAATGFRPDLSLHAEVRTELDPALESPRKLAPLIDPAAHSCLTVPAHGTAELTHPESGFYIAGMKSYGRAPTFLLQTGYLQVAAIAAELAGTAAPVDDTSGRPGVARRTTPTTRLDESPDPAIAACQPSPLPTPACSGPATPVVTSSAGGGCCG